MLCTALCRNNGSLTICSAILAIEESREERLIPVGTKSAKFTGNDPAEVITGLGRYAWKVSVITSLVVTVGGVPGIVIVSE
jgi:hypothetical protein